MKISGRASIVLPLAAAFLGLAACRPSPARLMPASAIASGAGRADAAADAPAVDITADRVTGRARLTLVPLDVTGRAPGSDRLPPSNEPIRLMLSAAFVADTADHFHFATLTLESTSKHTLFDEYYPLVFSLDRRPFDLGDGFRTQDASDLGWIHERILFHLTVGALATIGHASSVEGRLGSYRFRLRPTDVAALADFAHVADSLARAPVAR